MIRVIIALVALAGVSYCVAGCAPKEDPAPYVICDTPDCGDDVNIEVK